MYVQKPVHMYIEAIDWPRMASSITLHLILWNKNLLLNLWLIDLDMLVDTEL